VPGGTVESIGPVELKCLGPSLIQICLPKTPAMVSITPIIVPPYAPTGVSAVAGDQRATVSFTPPAVDGGSPIKFYTVYAKTKSGAFDQTATTSRSPITVTNLTAGQSYTFTVTATNRVGEGPASAPAAAVVPYRTPGPPTIASATPGNGQATVAVSRSSADQNLGNPITSYTVTARLGVNVTSGPGITATGTNSPITVSGLTNGQNYTVTVYASNLAGNGPESAPKVVFPATVPGATTNLVATNATPAGATSGSVSVTLTPPADNGGSPVLNYVVTAQPGGITTVTGNPTVVVGGLQVGTSYTFTAHATNAVGSGPESLPSNSVVPAPVGIPSPPVTPAAAPNNQMAFVSFSPPFTDGGSPIASYTVTAQPGGITATDTQSPILVMGLTNGTRYTFTVTATNTAGGTSQPSQPTSPVTPRVPSGPPPANDNFANAKAISGASGSVASTNVGATVEPGEPTIQDQAGGASVWYRWTAPTSGTVRFDTCTAFPAMDPNIEAFIGNSVTSLIPLGPGPGRDCPPNQFGSEVTFVVNANQAIYIKLDGVNFFSNANPPSEGPFSLEWGMQ
jgi:Fibronectin type III domain